jgi:CheY-like chemotaxis protein
VDLLVTDVILPGLSGVKLANRLRAERPSLRVLVCSGYMGEDGASGLSTDDGTTAFLPKPFTGPQLMSKVGALFA